MKTLLLHSSRSEDQTFGKEVAAIAGLAFHASGSVAETIQKIQENDIGAILVDASTEAAFMEFETTVQEQIGLFSDKLNSNHMHFISSDDLENARHVSRSPLFGSFIYRKYHDTETATAAARRYGHVVKASLQERAFGMKSFFSEKAQIQTIRIQKSSQKQQVVEAVRGFLVKAAYPSRMANVIATAVDELVMNAIFTAPVDEMGHRTYDTTPRDTVIELVDRQAIEITIAFDGLQVGISAVDQFGAIDKDKLIKHLSTVYTDEQYKVKTSVAGAGIGLATTFRSGGSLIFVCEKNARTEVAVVFERLQNYRDFKEQFRYITTQFYY